MNFTKEIEELAEQDEEVVLAVKIKEFAHKEREGKVLYEDGKLEELIVHRKNYIIELKEFEEIDKSGRISQLIESAVKQLSNLETEFEETKLLLTMTPSEVEFYRKFGKFPPVGRKRPLVAQKKRTYFDSADWSLNKTGPAGIPPGVLGAGGLLGGSPGAAFLRGIPAEQQVPQVVGLSAPRSSASVRKYFDSAEYMCRKDNSFNWKSSHISIKHPQT